MPRDYYDDDIFTPYVAPRIPLATLRDYKIEVKPLPCKPGEYQDYYWHLFYKGMKVNGGISHSTEAARERAVQYRTSHQHQIWVRTHVWDEEYRRWDTKHGNVVM